MKPELKAKWLEALRSGKYSQTTKVLQDSTGFCCLGVLCDVANPDAWQDFEWEYGDIVSDTELPQPFAADVGLTHGQEAALVKLNDEDQAPFSSIADYIEKQL